MDETYSRWDRYIHHLMVNIVEKQKNCEYFILGDLDPKDPYDLFFFRLSHLTTSLVKSCTVYGYISGIIKRIIFKIKEPSLRMVPFHVLEQMPSNRIIVINKTERKQLIETIGEQHEVRPEEIELIYKEYYAK